MPALFKADWMFISLVTKGMVKDSNGEEGKEKGRQGNTGGRNVINRKNCIDCMMSKPNPDPEAGNDDTGQHLEKKKKRVYCAKRKRKKKKKRGGFVGRFPGCSFHFFLFLFSYFFIRLNRP